MNRLHFQVSYKRLTDGCFAWPTTKDQVTVSLTKAQLSLLLDGIDWRRPSKIYRPRLAG
ncbi:MULTISPECIES: IS66 family insertion sequence element accessory protein TnpB [Mesorhizobium]|uniref:IS66 family insertion sequence element accessory protein TnpB n=1 Tax=Mesorhizobium cantuariense TaxID=1300275 RepID=A0ABV7MFU2_9HYPH|nr:IS66 family insertion sequence element accessory protein TnpB [Mesorhizobium sophorae]